ncbi:hypothetical protein BC937DRAFT_93733 [Endogone sp. FLAS-F59071]|nr:hypothetical protein BC937DRAFT_93733 [Endogone sp. FLAS-F59071]|eukprot:RUS14495.1 hypothetical protein BC937DRAFT_93733 [Endogone sp. FLAS-F59071]
MYNRELRTAHDRACYWAPAASKRLGTSELISPPDLGWRFLQTLLTNCFEYTGPTLPRSYRRASIPVGTADNGRYPHEPRRRRSPVTRNGTPGAGLQVRRDIFGLLVHINPSNFSIKNALLPLYNSWGQNWLRRRQDPKLSSKPFRDYERVRPDDLSSTITTTLRVNGPYAVPCMHWKDARLLSVHETKLLQGFLEEDVIEGEVVEKYRIVGNAVPRAPVFAMAVMLAEALKKKDAETVVRGGRPWVNVTQSSFLEGIVPMPVAPLRRGHRSEPKGYE